MKLLKRLAIVVLMGMLLLPTVSTNVKAENVKTLLGAGATFPYPLYSKWFDVYHKKTGIQINYQAIGSGGGIRQLLSRTVDFGGTDAFMSDQEMAKAPGKILHIPTTLGAVVVAYNLPGSPTLRLTPQVLTGIFLGKITRWNDPAITRLNPGVNLPSDNIVVVHRSDGSGTTNIFTDYLTKVSKEWTHKVGRGKSVNWPVGLGGKGNPGVAGLIAQIPGAVGYVELAYAVQNHLPVAMLQNKSGRFIKPSLASVSAAANVPLPPDTRVSITNTEAPDGYPISGFTWIILYQEQHYSGRSKARAKALVDLLWWCVHYAQRYNESLLYGKLPKAAVAADERILRSVTYDGRPLIK
jgi:phosphate transport system substrate-binding protein